MPNIVYLGAEDTKEAAGHTFARGVPTEVEGAIAGSLTTPKPRIFFYPAEITPDVQARLDAEYAGLPDSLIAEHTAHRKQYQRLADSYTDVTPIIDEQSGKVTKGKDQLAYEGAMSEVARSEDRIDEAQAMKRDRQAAANAEAQAKRDAAAAEAKAKADAAELETLRAKADADAKKAADEAEAKKAEAQAKREAADTKKPAT